MKGSTEPAASRASPGRILALWAAFALAFGPVFIDAIDHFAAHPWARYALLFPGLFALSALRDRDEWAPPRADGAILLALGLGLLVYGALMAKIRLGRLAASLAALGLCRSLGLGPTRAQPLLLFAVPLPGSIAVRGAPLPATTQLEGAQSVWNALGFESTAAYLGLAFEAGALELDRYDGGLPLVPLCAGLAYYVAAMRRFEPWRMAASIVLATLLSPVLQFGFILAAAGCAALGQSGVAQWLVSHEWIVIAVPVLIFAELMHRRSPAR